MQPLSPWSFTGGAAGYLLGRVPVSQSWSGLYWIGKLIEWNPQLKSCFEVGTLNGAFTSLLALSFPGATFTCDIEDRRPPHAKLLHERLGVTFWKMDALKGTLLGDACRAIPRPALFFLDNGDKELEFERVAPFVLPGDLIIVHDAHVEFQPDGSRAKGAASAAGLMELYREQLDADKTFFSCWRKQP